MEVRGTNRLRQLRVALAFHERRSYSAEALAVAQPMATEGSTNF
ncbi:MAG: hypothetical protein SFU99_16805 [Saprospiraceae bacterium]|nr:hypothetical protein [Saprospiraceae bacterium]